MHVLLIVIYGICTAFMSSNHTALGKESAYCALVSAVRSV